MRSIVFKILIVLFLISLISCKKEVSTYFSGQIINPKVNNIEISYKGKQFISKKINKKHQFLIQFDTISEGLYVFKHGEEYQYVYIEPSDSIVMRLNTWDFDESLIFSGKGAEKNNFLMQLFLSNESDDKLFYSFYGLSENKFLEKIDSILAYKLTLFEKFRESTIISKNVEELIKTAIYFPIYIKKEKYIEKFRKHHKGEKLISKSFYEYRKDIPINELKHLDYYGFKRRYIDYYFYNNAKEICSNDQTKKLSLMIMSQIEEHVKNKELKNSMLYNAVVNCLLDDKCQPNDTKKVRDIFYTNCTNTENINKIKTLDKTLKVLTKNSIVPKIALKDFENKKILLKEVIKDKNVVFYFWPNEPNRINYMTKRVHFLTKKFKNITFIGIDNQLSNDKWRSLIKDFNLTRKYQFQLIDTTQNKWFINRIPRAVIVDEKSVIQNNFSHLAHRNFEELLMKL